MTHVMLQLTVTCTTWILLIVSGEWQMCQALFTVVMFTTYCLIVTTVVKLLVYCQRHNIRWIQIPVDVLSVGKLTFSHSDRYFDVSPFHIATNPRNHYWVKKRIWIFLNSIRLLGRVLYIVKTEEKKDKQFKWIGLK